MHPNRLLAPAALALIALVHGLPAAAAKPTPAAAAATPAPAAAADGPIAAEVGGTRITMREVDSVGAPRRIQIDGAYESQLRALDIQRAKAKAALVERTVDQLVTDRLLELEAAAKGTTAEQLLADLKSAPVTDADVAAFHTENATRINRPLADVSAQIRDLLVERATTQARNAYVAELRSRYGVRTFYDVQRYDVSGGRHERGASAAPVTIVEFADFQCPYCARLAPLLDRLLEKYPTQVRHVYRHFPLTSIHPQAEPAAVAAECAAEQQRFWPLHDAMLKDQSKLQREALIVAASGLGLDAAAFTACLDSPAAKAAVERDAARARELPVEGTPALFVNGRMYLGNIDYDALVKYVDEELARATPRAASATQPR